MTVALEPTDPRLAYGGLLDTPFGLGKHLEDQKGA